MKYLRLALYRRREAKDIRGERVTLNNIGNIYFKKGNLHTAFKYFQTSLDIATKIGDKIGESITLNSIAIIHSINNDHDIALDLLDRSSIILKENRNAAGLCNNLLTQALVLWRNQESKKALKNFIKAHKIAAQINQSQILQTLDGFAAYFNITNTLEDWEMLAQKIEAESFPPRLP